MPGDQVGPERRESQLEDVVGINGRDNISDGRIDDGDPSEQPVSLLLAFGGGLVSYFSGEAHAK